MNKLEWIVFIILAVCLIVFVSLFLFGNPVSSKPLSGQVFHGGWTLLHTSAIAYPVSPTSEEREAMQYFINGMSRTFPCLSCRDHFRGYVIGHPPNVTSRNDLIIWMWSFHNAVNERLGKQKFNLGDYKKTWDPNTNERVGCQFCND